VYGAISCARPAPDLASTVFLTCCFRSSSLSSPAEADAASPVWRRHRSLDLLVRCAVHVSHLYLSDPPDLKPGLAVGRQKVEAGGMLCHVLLFPGLFPLEVAGAHQDCPHRRVPGQDCLLPLPNQSERASIMRSRGPVSG